MTDCLQDIKDFTHRRHGVSGDAVERAEPSARNRRLAGALSHGSRVRRQPMKRAPHEARAAADEAGGSVTGAAKWGEPE